MTDDTKGAGATHDATCVVVPHNERDWGSRRRPCGKPAKGALWNGDPACGLHLAAEKRSAANTARRKAERDEATERARKAAEACAAIDKRCSALEPQPYHPPYGPLRGGPDPEYVVVRVDALLALMDGGDR